MKHIDYNKLLSRFSVPGGLRQTWLFVILMVASVALQAQPCSGPPSSAGTSSASSTTVCFGESVTLSSAGASSDDGIVYQWYVSANSGGPYSAISGASSTSYNFNVSSATAYYVLSVKCSNTGDSVLSNEVQVTVSALSGTYTIGAPASCTQFASIADFLTALNTVGVSGPVTLDVPAGYTETTPAGGLALSQCGLAAGLRTSAANPLIIQKSGSGANPIITGAAGTGTKDGIFWIVGADYVTIDGINLQGSASFLPDPQHEFGYALVRCDGTDGAQHNTIKNCAVSLNRNNATSYGIYSGSITRDSVVVTVTALSGTNSNNAFYSNTVSNAYFGIYISGFNHLAIPFGFYDQNNIIGANGQGNTITTFGNGSAGTTAVAAGILFEYNNNIQVRYNTIAGSGHTGLVSCIYSNTARWANIDITNNTITASSAAASGAAHIYNIYNVGGSRLQRADPINNVINITHNSIQNCAVPTASSGRLWGIANTKPTVDSLSAFALNITNNSFTGNNNSSASASDGFAMIFAISQVPVSQVNISNNTLSNNQLAGGSGAGNRMIVTGTPGNTPLWEATFNLSNNTLTNNSVSAAGGIMTGIAMENYAGNSMLSGSITINGNTITGITQSTATATGLFQGIACLVNFNSFISAAAVPATITNNTISNIVRSASTTGGFNGISCTGVPLALTITGNQVINNSIGGTASGTTGTFTGITGPTTNGAFIPTVNVSNNTVTGNTHNGTGTSTLINGGSGVSVTVNNNTVGNHVKTTIPSSTTNATISCIIVAPPNTQGNQTTNHTISGNSIENIRILGISGNSTANTINGILNNGATASETVTNNTIKTLFSSGTATGYTTNIFGIRSPGAAAANRIISGNTVSNLYNIDGNGVIRAIRSEAGNIVDISKNKIFDIYPGRPVAAASGTSTAVGVSVSSGTQHDIYNNIIGLGFNGLINQPSYTSSNAVMGIEIANTVTSHTINVRYNTIRMSGAPGSGTSFGSSGIAVTSATPPVVELSNNLVNNLLTPGGTSPGVSAAYRRAVVIDNTNYSENSNNNLFYAGAPGVANLIYFDGTNSDQTMAAFKARASALTPVRDASSVSENVTFLNTATGANADFLHIDPTVATLVESGAKSIASITTDYDGDTRSSTPDIGADEGTYIALQPSFGNVSIAPNTPQCIAIDHVVTVVINNGGAPVTGVTLNYSFNGVAAGSVAMTNTTGNTWTGTIPAATPVNAVVTWSLVATDGIYSPSFTGTSYQDAYLTGTSIVPGATASAVCLGSSVTLNVGQAPAPSAYPVSGATDPADEEILGVTFGTINNISTCTSLAPGAGSVLGGYGNYTESVSPTTVSPGQVVPFSVQIGTCGGNYGNRSVIYIDWNRDGDFIDAFELAAAEPSAVTGPHTWSGNITVPSFSVVSAGFTRMRVINNEITGITSSNVTFSWGETEDYTIQVLPLNATYSWSDGTNTVGTGTSVTVTPTAAGIASYTVIATDLNGCTLTSAPVNITVNTLPSSPAGTPSSQCGAGVPAIKVSGGVAYNWYLQSTGGTPVQSSSADSLTSYSITATTTFYVGSIDPNTNCESPRTAVVATVIQPDAVSASVNNSFICPGTLVTLTATQTGSSNNYVFTWSGNGLVSTSGTVVTANPPATGANVYTVTAVDASVGCVATASVTVTGNTVPATVSANVTPTVICQGASVSLSGGPSGPIPSTYAASGANFADDGEILNVTVGSINNSSTCAVAAPGPGSALNLYGNYTTTVAPITVTPGQVVSYSLQIGTCGGPYSNRIAVFIDWNRDGDLFDADENPVLSPVINGPGFATGTFTVPAGLSAGNTLMRVVLTETTGPVSPAGFYGYGETEDYMILLDPNPGATYFWSYNGTNIGSGTSQTHTPTSSGTAQYALVVTGSNGCSASFPAEPVIVNALPPAPTTTPSTQCGAGVPTASATSVSGLTGPIFNWYTTASGGSPIQSSTSTVLTSYLVTNTLTLHVSEVDAVTGCEGARTPVVITVNQPDSVAVSVSAGPYCLGGSITLSAVNTGSTNNYAYSWNGTPAGSGFTGPVSGASATVTPTSAGNYAYTLTAVDGQCTYVGVLNVTISDNPIIASVNAVPSGTICSGSPATLTALTYDGYNTSNPANYIFAQSTGTYTPLVGGTPSTASGDDGSQTSIPIGFPFNYNGVSQTIFTINTNGNLRFGASAPPSSWVNSLTTKDNVLAPLWDDNNKASGTISYATSGTAGNRVLTVEWSGIAIGGGGSSANPAGSFQVKLYEENNSIKFVYGAIAPMLNVSASIGISGSAGSYISVTPGSPATASNSIEDNFVSSELFLASGTTYTFTPPLATGPGNLTWTWNPGALNGNNVVVNPTSATTYTVTATNLAGCTNTSSISVNTATLPSQPITLDGSRCGFGPANVGVISTTGAATPVFNWYTTATGGTPIQSGPATSLTNYNVSVTDTFWVAEIDLLGNPNCESPRTIVIQEVIQPDAVTATSSSTTVCLPTSGITLNAVQTGSGNTYTFNWSANPATGSGMETPVVGASQTIIPTTGGTYTYTVNAVDGDCAYQSTITVVVGNPPTKPNIGPDQVVCAGTNLSFTVFDNTLIGGGIQSAASFPDDDEIFNVTITGTTLNNTSDCNTLAPGVGSILKRYSNFTTSVPAPTLVPGNSYTGSVTIGQCNGAAYNCGYAVFIDYNRNGLFDLPQERVAAGPALTADVAGTVFPFSFSLPSNAAPGIARMRIVAVEDQDGTTGAIAPNGPYNWGETEDYAVRLDPNPGATYQWTSIPSGFSSTATTISTGPIPASTTYIVTVTSTSGCTTSDTVAVTAITTPDVPLYTNTADTVCVSGTVTFQITNISPGVSYQWQSAASASGPWTDIFGASATNFITPNLAPVLGDSSVYFRVVSSCGAAATPSAPKLIYVARPSIASATGVTRCGPGSVTLNAIGSGNLDWYSAPTGGTSLGSGGTLTTTVAGTTTLYVGASVGTCETIQRTAVNVTVTPAPTISATASPAAICEGASTTLTVTSSNTAYTFLWESTVSGATYTVTPTSTSAYTVTAFDSTTGCAAIANVGVTVNQNPVIASVTSNPAVVCADLPFTLTANAIAAGPQTPPAGYCAASGSTATDDEQIFGVSFAGMDNLNQGETCANNNSDYTTTIPAVTVNAGSSYPFTVITDECDGATYYPSGLAIYIDYNRDGDWDDLGEQAYTTTTTTLSPNTRTGTISIPLSASLGVTRMRVIVIESNISPAACQFFSYGEAEDYLVNILGPAATFNWSPANLLDNSTIATPSCTGITSSTTFTVTATSNAGCTASDSISITVAPGPEPVITTNDTTFCAPNEITIRVADAGPFSGGYPSGTTFEWVGITPPIAGLDTISSINGSSFSVVVTLPSGCADTSNVRNIVTRSVVITENIVSGTCLDPNGSIIANIVSGTAPYNFIWSTDSAQTNVIRNTSTSNTQDSLSGFAPGTYYLSVADLVGDPAGCSSTLLFFTISAPEPVVASTSSTDITCNGASDGSATVSWTGGTAPVNVLWSNGESTSSITVTTGSTLSVIITDNGGCADTASVTVSEPAPIQLTLSYTPASEPGALDGTATVVVNGGSAPYSYDWIDDNSNPYSGSTITGLAAGNYFSLVTDANNCQSTIGSVAVGSNGRLTVTALIEGFYDGAGGMYPVLLSNGSIDPTETDSIRIELRDPLSVSTAVAGATTVIGTNGQAKIIIPESLLAGSYYIAVSHRNAVETWSAAPVAMSLLATYDFTTAASQAYGDNMINLGGVFAFFSGDLAPQDFVVDIFDQVPLDNDIANFNGGYIVTDLNGDGVTDLFDQVLMDNNIANFVGSAQPF